MTILFLKLHQKGDIVMENELKEKEYYRQAIVDIIMKIDRLNVLEYLYELIRNIVKEGR